MIVYLIDFKLKNYFLALFFIDFIMLNGYFWFVRYDSFNLSFVIKPNREVDRYSDYIALILLWIAALTFLNFNNINDKMILIFLILISFIILDIKFRH